MMMVTTAEAESTAVVAEDLLPSSCATQTNTTTTWNRSEFYHHIISLVGSYTQKQSEKHSITIKIRVVLVDATIRIISMGRVQWSVSEMFVVGVNFS